MLAMSRHGPCNLYERHAGRRVSDDRQAAASAGAGGVHQVGPQAAREPPQEERAAATEDLRPGVNALMHQPNRPFQRGDLMRRMLTLFVVLATITTLAHGQGSDEANAIIDKAIAAHGLKGK